MLEGRVGHPPQQLKEEARRLQSYDLSVTVFLHKSFECYDLDQ